MGRKVHPIGMRLGINQGWQGRWFAEGNQYRDQLHQDFAIRNLLMGVPSKGGAAKSADVRKLRKDIPDTIKNGRAGISRVEVERYPGKIRVAIYTAKPGILIGRKGEGVKKVRACLETLVGRKVDLDIKEIASPDTDAMLVAKKCSRSVGTPHCLSPRDETRDPAGNEAGRSGDQDSCRRAFGRRGNVSRCLVARWTCAIADPTGESGLRQSGSYHNLWSDRCNSLGL